jgi:hypothetical protein
VSPKFGGKRKHAGKMAELRINNVLVLLARHAAQENSHRGFLFVFDGIWYCHWIAVGTGNKIMNCADV